MEQPEARPTCIALLIVTAALAIALAVLEALASDREIAFAPSAPWTEHLRRVDDALRRNNVDVAARAWQDAYVTSIGSRRWEGMLAVGQAALRVGDASGTRLAAGSRARQAYLVALFRARDDRSLDGLLRVGEAFAALGDEALA